jgi:hypothetical protein
MLRRASGYQRAPGILSPSMSTVAPLREAITPQASHTSPQNSSGFSTDQSWNSW